VSHAEVSSTSTMASLHTRALWWTSCSM
jgi:hypothetical protein